MLTPQEVSTHAFSKARMGGYNMAMVDEFLDTLTEDYTTLYKENAALKAKLKVLVEKVEEYRATEDSMRATLLAAQRMAQQMVDEAEQKKVEMLKQVEIDVAARKKQLKAEVAEETERLRIARKESAEFLSNMRRLCNSELEFLNGVPKIPVAEAAAAAVSEIETEEQVESIEASVLSSFEEDDKTKVLPTEEVQAAAEEEPAVPEAEEAEEAAPAEKAEEAEEAEDLDATRRIDFGDLKFGRNYKKKR